jgi:hypothetical protein
MKMQTILTTLFLGTLIANAQLEFRTALKPLMGENLQAYAHFIHLSPNCVTD